LDLTLSFILFSAFTFWQGGYNVSEQYLGKSIKKLGFGLMRLPMQGQEIDIEQTKKMVDSFIAKGFSYFDTAYVYIGSKSEVALKEAVTDRYPRESFQAATKMPLWICKTPDDLQKLFDESCERAGLSYYDFYLLHALNKDSYQQSEELHAWEFIQKMKAEGKIRHIGFSFHDSAEVLDTILKAHPETEFVQLQINYADWESDNVQSRKCYEVAKKYNVPVVIMEPVKGGSLASMTPKVRELLEKANPDASIASWAVRYAASLPGVVTVLSGMSDTAQMEDNCSYMENFEPLSDSERATIDEVVKVLDSLPTIPCTSCRYCVDDCPQQINIPEIIGTLNAYTLYQNKAGSMGHYRQIVKEKGKASDCIACGACEGHCPQHIEIIDTLKKAAGLFE